MDINLIIEDATANPIKFTLDGAPVDKRARFDQQRYAQANHTTIDPDKVYKQKFESADTVRLQFYSNFPLNKVSIVDCHDTVYGSPMTPTVAVEYRNKFYRAQCMLASMNGFLFIFFTQGLEYEDADFAVPGDLIAWSGRLPNINAQVGDVVRYSFDMENFNAGNITEIKWNPELQAEGYLIDVPITLVNPVAGWVEVSYNEKPANLYSLQFSFLALQPGTYFIRREHGIDVYDVSFTSEPLDIQEVHEDTLALEYRHEGTYNRTDLWNYVYLENWSNIIRIPAAFYKFSPAGEVDLDVNDSGIPRILRAVPFRQIELNFFNMPSWLADKIQMALAHDTKVINGYQWEVENFGQFETIDRLDLGTYIIVLRQKDDRAKKTDSFTYVITAEFTPPVISDVPATGQVVFSTFHSNTLGVFHFVTVPPGMLADNLTFVDGDLCSFFVSPHDSTIPRQFVLIAVCDTIPGLQAEITFNQLGVEPPPEFLDVSSLDVSLHYSIGSAQVLDVNSSGDYDISFSGAFTFAAVKQAGFSQVRISAPTANPGPADRVGVVRLTLQSDPLIFKDINVTQIAPPPPPPSIMMSVSPEWYAIPPHGGTRNVFVTVAPGGQWQAYASASWMSVSGAVKTGSQSIAVTCSGATIYDPLPRTGVVTFYNIANPSDLLTVEFEQ